jgi:hypothetical protein
VITYPAYVTKELAFDGPVKKGDRGVKVKRVQEWVSIHGFRTPADSDFGDATKKCVRDFQTARGLDVSGTVDSGTWTALVDPLARALEPFEPSRGLSLAATVLRVAKQHLSQEPVEMGGDNRGPWVRVYMGGSEGTEWRWCAGFVTFVMKQACLLREEPQPIQGSYSCDSLAYQAKEAGLFTRGTEVATGTVPWSDLGAAQIFLVRRTSTDWTHTGFSFTGSGSTFSTIEGNTNDDGNNNGFEVCKRTRSVPGKDFIRIAS